MTLQSNGAISFSNINVELGLSSTAQLSIGGAAARALAGVASGAISLSNFYGKTNYLDQQTITNGVTGDKGGSYYGYKGFSPTCGSISDGTFNPYSGAAIQGLYWTSAGSVIFRVAGSQSNSGWTTVQFVRSSDGQTLTLNRANGSYSNAGSYTQWTWTGYSSFNPFPTSSSTTTANFT